MAASPARSGLLFLALISLLLVPADPANAQRVSHTKGCPGGATLEDLLRAFVHSSSGRDSAWDALMETGRVRFIPTPTSGQLLLARTLPRIGTFARVRPDTAVRGLREYWTPRSCVEVTGSRSAVRYIGPYGFPETAGRFEVTSLNLYPDPRYGALGRYHSDQLGGVDAYLYPGETDVEGRGGRLDREFRKAQRDIEGWYERRDTTLRAGEWESVTPVVVSDSAGMIEGRRGRITLHGMAGEHAGEELQSYLYVFVRGRTAAKVRATFADSVPDERSKIIDEFAREFARLLERMPGYDPPKVRLSDR